MTDLEQVLARATELNIDYVKVLEKATGQPWEKIKAQKEQ